MALLFVLLTLLIFQDRNNPQSLIPNSAKYRDVNYEEYYYHVAVLYEFILCSGVTMALTLLLFWHIKMISSGETNIEVHINRKEQIKFKKKNLVSSLSKLMYLNISHGKYQYHDNHLICTALKAFYV